MQSADLVDMQLKSEYKNIRIQFLLCVIEIFRKYAWVTPLKAENDISVINSFQKFMSLL